MIRYTHIPPDSTSVLVNNGESIKVTKITAGLLIQNSGTLTINDKDGNLIFQIELRTGPTYELETSFLAKNGISVTTMSTIRCTVFHSNSGA